MRIRPGRAEDYEAIARIQSASPEAAQWEPSGYELLVAELDGSLAGFLVWRAVAHDEAEILNLAVTPIHRRRGIARALLAQIPKPALFLEVREGNQAARALYRSCGFEEAGRRPAYYRHPPETAIVMKRYMTPIVGIVTNLQS